MYTYDNIMSLRAKRSNLQITGVDYPPELSYLATDSTFNHDAVGNRRDVNAAGRGKLTHSRDESSGTQGSPAFLIGSVASAVPAGTVGRSLSNR